MSIKEEEEMKLFGKKENKDMSKEWTKEVLCGLLNEVAESDIQKIVRTDKNGMEQLKSMFQAMGSH